MSSAGKLPSEAERTLVRKSGAWTNPAYGCAPEKRPINEYIKKGVVNIDKPAGPTSHEVAAWVKDILGVSRAGHAGSLDPKVTGLLPTLLGTATKAVPALRLSGKEYICLLKLHRPVSAKYVREVCEDFVGPIYQLPPIKSAVKRALRVRTIYYLEVLEINGTSVLFRVGCEAGTYIRKLCHDIGLALGCGGHMQELRRTKAGPFTEATLITLQDLKDAYVFWQEDGDESEIRKVVRPMESAVSHLPKIILRDSAVDAVCSGASLAVPGITSLDSNIRKGDLVGVFTLKGEIVALAKAEMNTEMIMGASAGIAAVPIRVMMEAGTYPRGWAKKDDNVIPQP
ncbi:RNA-guided pseudouridylation complex pseudouridine synthase subunit Cbf5 [Methanosarcina sp. KYL-1]|uniref:RNA-guided pseudouridylation complex pseudouridine synthase subunit Cbf5 n=1 Tax=Methanosarcina sp. KYL-1 TaxID=2602068 RepID=UPI0021009D00|nr:RNA-guided pseudouridylation complex pseudouridine synthase subunit Cbf5 [Methanosarcina sp. KYL-1]MCQ1535539.1 RNA-guided pseudouridylation complex pseudouridine synthase subunit Cbf5 [Methanosarcina sp. KYL-1]